MQTTLSTLQQVTTSDEIDRFANCMISEIENSIVKPAEAFAQIKIIETAFDKVKKQCKDIFTEEAEKLKGNGKYFGFVWNTQEKTTKKNFTNCGHSILIGLYKERKELDERIKAIENSLISMSSDTPIFDPKTGEICHKPVIEKTTSIVLTKK